MNKAFYILFFVLSSVFVKAQSNLIYNGDFELYDTCPVSLSSPFDVRYEIEHCIGWKSPTYGTSDYFNLCSSSVGIPNNAVGMQYALSGSGYCGFIAYFKSGGSLGCTPCGCGYNGNYWWEYIQGKFISPMIAGHTYKISFYVSLAETSNTAVSEIGCYISNSPVISCNSQPLNYTPQISSNSGFLNDSSNWTLIFGDYLAFGGEQYITIGNFRDTLNTDTISFASDWNPPLSYYYIDAATAYDYADDNSVNVFTPNSDGINDVFYLWGLFEGDSYSIYDRWGIKVYEAEYGTGWSGQTNSGENCVDGVYYYVSKQKNRKGQKGFIQLLR